MAGQRGKGNFILKIDTGSGTATVSQEQVMSRLVLFTEWLQNQKSETETWADIFDAQPD